MDRPLLTVSVAAYNVEKYIEKTLECFQDPALAGLVEVLVTDDGGSDSTMEKAGRIAEEYPEIFTLCHKENGGWGSTVNYGLARAKGKYFKLLDGDDWFDKEGLNGLLEYLAGADTDLVYTPYRVIEDGTMAQLSAGGGTGGLPFNERLDFHKVADRLEPTMHCMTFRTEALKGNVEILEHCFYTDVEYTMRSFCCVDSVCCLEKPLYCYRVGRSGQSMSIAGVRKHHEDHLRVVKSLLSFRDEFRNGKAKGFLEGDKLLQVMDYRVGGMVNSQYFIYYLLGDDRSFQARVREFDRFLKENHPDMYKDRPVFVRINRLIGFHCFPLMSLGIRTINRIKKLYY